ncbi:MAG: DUF1858 domain-containing protein [Acetivibrionales bacterium]|jgi:hypothetical protein
MGKTVDFTRTIYEICRDDPEIVQIMTNLGFENIANPAMLNTAGRFMTIPRGAAIKGIQMEKIKDEFTRRGYRIRE